MKRSSNATFLGDTVCRGETLPWLELGPEWPLTALVGDMLVILMYVIESMDLNGGWSDEGGLMEDAVVQWRVVVNLAQDG